MIGWLLIGLVLAGLLLLLLDWWANTTVVKARQTLFWGIVGLCILIGVLLLASGRGFFAVIPAGYAAWKMFGAGKGPRSAAGGASSRRGNGMSRDEALDVLGLEEGASEDEINAAYRRLMAQCHPDKGGSDWMASKLNDARRTLLGK